MFMELEKIISAESARAVFEKATDSIICYKPFRDESGKVIDFIFLYLNNAALVTLEGSRQDFTNNRFLPLFPGSIESGLYGAFLRVFETGISEEIEFHYSDEKYNGWYKDIIIKNDD